MDCLRRLCGKAHKPLASVRNRETLPFTYTTERILQFFVRRIHWHEAEDAREPLISGEHPAVRFGRLWSMERQISFAQGEFAAKKKQTRRERFLGEMEQAVPWARLVGLVEPFYPKGERGRPPLGVERMLRVCFLQQWVRPGRRGVGGCALRQPGHARLRGSDLVPAATTLLNFRHLLEGQKLTKQIFGQVNALLTERGVLLREGPIVDATIIAAPASTKNKAKERDPEMHQAKKGNEWHFGMKVHIGVDLKSSVVHSLMGTAANVADIVETHQLLHGQEKNGYVDAGYTGVEKRAEILAKFPHVRWHVTAKRGKIKAMAEGKRKATTQALEKAKAIATRLCGTSFPCRQKPLPSSQGALSRFGQEHGAVAPTSRLG